MGYDEMREAGDGTFEVKTATEWIAGAADEPPQQMLFDELWQTGEIAVMFAGPGCGKSILAVQIADSIARGKAMEPFQLTAPRQKVLYIDLEHTAGRFRARYSAASANGKTRPAKVHAFSENFLRLSPRSSDDLRVSQLGPAIEQTGARVVIIDSIAHLQRYQIPRETAVVMRELRKLRDRYGLSILVINHARPSFGRLLSIGDMMCAGAMTTFADNIFAIGQCATRADMRYIKHVKAGSSPLAYGSAHVPYFTITGLEFPHFDLVGYASELELNEPDDDQWEWDVIRQIKRMREAGHTIRIIADDMGMSRSTVHRYLQMAPPEEPPPPPPEPVFYHFEKCIYDRCKGCNSCSGLAANNRKRVPGNIYGHENCPDNCDICGPRAYRDDDTTVNPNLKRLSERHYEELRQWLIEGKRDPRPVYPGARRYGVAAGCWIPGSETWTEEQFAEFRRITSRGNRLDYSDLSRWHDRGD